MNGGGADGPIDEALGADPLLHGLDKLLGLIAGEAKELLALLEELEGNVGGGHLLATELLLGLYDACRHGDELLVGDAQCLNGALYAQSPWKGLGRRVSCWSRSLVPQHLI